MANSSLFFRAVSTSLACLRRLLLLGQLAPLPPLPLLPLLPLLPRYSSIVGLKVDLGIVNRHFVTPRTTRIRLHTGWPRNNSNDRQQIFCLFYAYNWHNGGKKELSKSSLTFKPWINSYSLRLEKTFDECCASLTKLGSK